MLKPDQIRTRIEQMLQQGPFAGLSDDLRLAMRSQLNALLTSADIVTREEFEVQAEALRRTTARLAELEAIVARLEAAQH
ncbi:accessory factor UbiK family protein [Thalassolituus marinus]|uniref:Accessory factor UbiK family protein n=1 Tax=Thalassolituus marinus TaxID=671053 RepID=A0ABS7ZK29_9GAMM|nr:accessory factor UbiK family protein [Thalassolituus marinus]MCA6062067.1 accessory factor UbiK family protein [Thalassolituus marinus]